MTAILHRLPFLESADEIAVGQERVRVRPYQIIVWVSLTAKYVHNLPPNAPRFPAILDTSHNQNFSLRHQYLSRWAGVDPDHVPKGGAIREGGRRVDLVRLNVWLHPNGPGQRDRFADRSPFCLELPEGVAVYRDAVGYPPLPLLGEVDPILWTKKGPSLATLLPAFLTGNSWLVLHRRHAYGIAFSPGETEVGSAGEHPAKG